MRSVSSLPEPAVKDGAQEIFNDDDDDTSICVYIKSDNCTGSKYRLSPTCTLADALNEYLTVNYPYSCVTIRNL
jgi:hypothetical protein